MGGEAGAERKMFGHFWPEDVVHTVSSVAGGADSVIPYGVLCQRMANRLLNVGFGCTGKVFGHH